MNLRFDNAGSTLLWLRLTRPSRLDRSYRRAARGGSGLFHRVSFRVRNNFDPFHHTRSLCDLLNRFDNQPSLPQPPLFTLNPSLIPQRIRVPLPSIFPTKSPFLDIDGEEPNLFTNFLFPLFKIIRDSKRDDNGSTEYLRCGVIGELRRIHRIVRDDEFFPDPFSFRREGGEIGRRGWEEEVGI